MDSVTTYDILTRTGEFEALSEMSSHDSAGVRAQANSHCRRIRVCHIAIGGMWAGAEAQIGMLLCLLAREPALEVSAILLSEGKLADVLRDGGVSVMVLDHGKLTFWQIFFGLLKLFYQTKIDIVHTHGFKANVMGAAAAKLRKVPCVCKTVHGMPEPYQGVNRLKMSLYNLLDRFADTYFTDSLVAVSLDIKQRLSETYGHPHDSRVVCIQNGINVNAITVQTSSKNKKQDLQIRLTNRVIMIAGRLVPVKGLEYFLKAAQLIVKARTDVTFLIVGDGPLRDDLESLSRDLKLDDYVRFLGWCEDIYDLVNMTDVLVLASLHEGIPMILLEALAMGKSVVATRTGGIPEVIVEPALGTLVETKSAEAIATSCLRLLNLDSREERERRKQYIASRFSGAASSKKFVQLYQRLSGVPMGSPCVSPGIGIPTDNGLALNAVAD